MSPEVEASPVPLPFTMQGKETTQVPGPRHLGGTSYHVVRGMQRCPLKVLCHGSQPSPPPSHSPDCAGILMI